MTEHEPYSELAWEGLAASWEARGERHRAAEARERFERLMDRSLSPSAAPAAPFGRIGPQRPAVRPLGGPACTSST